MDILNPIKKVVEMVKGKIDDVAEANPTGDELDKWRKKLQVAQANFDLTIMDEREYIYLGTKAVDKNVNTNQRPSKMANNVYNIAFEFIETQLNTQIPQPSVRSVREPYENQARMIEDSIADKLKQMEVEEVTDINERVTPVQGYSIMELCWNNDIEHQLYTGDMELYSKHPKQVITQPGVYRMKYMDYFFVLTKVTPDYVMRRFDKDLENQTEQYPQNTNLYGVTRIDNSINDHSLTLIDAWYRDENNDIGKFSWINDTVVEDLPQYFYHRDENGEIMEFETLIEDKILLDERVIPMGSQIPYYVPDCYPFVIRRNVPKNFDFGGQSDIDVIRDQQDSIKKVVTKMEEKVIKAGSIVTAADDHNVTITDQVYQVIKGNQAQLMALGVKDLAADISRDMEFVQLQYKQAQSMLGITDSFQGKEDDTASSGKAKQIQVQQASGRLQSKQFNKNASFKELFIMMFKFMLAFYDEPRAYVAKDQMGKTLYAEFDKYEFLMQDADGKWYYNTDFLFSSDAGSGLPKDSIFMYNQVKEMYQMQAIDRLQYWTILEYLNFPMAKQIKAQIELQMQQQAEMQQAQMQAEAAAAQQKQQTPSFDDHMGKLSPEHQAMFKSMPPEYQGEVKKYLQGAGAAS